MPGAEAQSFFVACAKGLEYLLVDELLSLGAAKATAAQAGVHAEGDAMAIHRAVLWSRLGSRVLWPLTSFDCPDEHALYAAVHGLDWRQHLDPAGSLAVQAHLSGPGLTHARYAAQRVKDAIVDRLRFETGQRPSVDVDDPDLRLDLVLKRGRATLSVDLAGPLHRRGWRLGQGDAPLKETLACAVLLRAGWPRHAAAGQPLFDPMCGSGTLLIEGALMAADVAPGWLRHGEQHPTRWKGFDGALWASLLDEARARDRRAELSPRFHGCDSDARVVQQARRNAEAAGVDAAMTFETRDIRDTVAPVPGPGVVVCNPPYDQRLAADAEFYASIGQALRTALPDWSAALLCGSRELAFATGLRGRKTYTLFNGSLECTLLVCDPIAGRMRPEGEARPLSEGATMVANRLRKTLKHQQGWRHREGIHAWRAYDADLPEYAAAVDVYEEDGGQARTFLHVQEYAAPASVPVDDARRRFAELQAALREVWPLPREQVAIKTRQRGKGGSQYGRLAAQGAPFVVREGGVRLEVDLFGYLDTGLFLDHRPTRLRIGREAEGKRFLNLFAYTGTASVHAAVGGAARTTTVDLSSTYLQWASRNFAHNGIAGPAHRFVQADALAFLEADRESYDLVFCDPPTFSNSARAEDFDVQKSHLRLLRAAMARLSPGGLLLFSNNFRRFRLDEAGVSDFAACREITPATIPADFARNPRIHRVWELRGR